MSDRKSTAYKPIPSFTEWYPGKFQSEGFDRYSDLLKQTKSNFGELALRTAVSAATRYAAIDTGAIEGLYTVDRGFTRTIATQSAAWEAAMASKGQHVKRAFDDAMNAYEFVLDAATESVVVTEVFIRELHSLVCASQDTYEVHTAIGAQNQQLPKGEYKSMPNSPTLAGGHIHAYAPVEDTAPEMYRLVQELRSETFLAAHPIVQAAYAHYAYVCIHPFADGNGRVARALASIYLYRNPGIPLVIFADQRNPYFDALEAADKGNAKPFIDFIGERAVDAIGLVRSSMQSASSSSIATVDNLRELFATQSSTEEIRAAAVRLRDMVVNEIAKQFHAMKLPDAIEFTGGAYVMPGSHEVPDGYDALGKDGSLYFVITSRWPREGRTLVNVDVGVARLKDERAELVVASGDSDGLEVWLRELVPQSTATLTMKLTNWVEGTLRNALEDFYRQVSAS